MSFSSAGNTFIIKFSQFEQSLANLNDSTAKLYYSPITQDVRIQWMNLRHQFNKAQITMEIFNKYFETYLDTFKRSVMLYFECFYIDEEQTIYGLRLKSKFKKIDHSDYSSAMLVSSSINTMVSLRPKIAIYPTQINRFECPGGQQSTFINSATDNCGTDPNNMVNPTNPNVSTINENNDVGCDLQPQEIINNENEIDFDEDEDQYEYDEYDEIPETASSILNRTKSGPAAFLPTTPTPSTSAAVVTQVSTKRKANDLDDDFFENDDNINTNNNNNVAASARQLINKNTNNVQAKRSKFYSYQHDVLEKDKLKGATKIPPTKLKPKKLNMDSDSSASSASSSRGDSDSEFGLDDNDEDPYEEDNPILELQSNITDIYDGSSLFTDSIASSTYNDLNGLNVNRRQPSEIGSSIINKFTKVVKASRSVSSKSSIDSAAIKKIQKSKQEQQLITSLISISSKLISNLPIVELDEVQFREIYKYYSKGVLNEKDLMRHDFMQDVNLKKLRSALNLFNENRTSHHNIRMLILVLRQLLMAKNLSMREFFNKPEN